jgi:hypothetical protein
MPGVSFMVAVAARRLVLKMAIFERGATPRSGLLDSGKRLLSCVK